jgi:DNA polymerase I-like protein with 3'-5' exonuclease and polymerase domains
MNNDGLPWFVGKQGLEALKRKSHYVVLDYENTILPGFATNPDNHLVLACWYVVKDGVVKKKYKFADEYNQHELAADVEAADFVVAHNAKYETQWLHRSGVDIYNLLVFCTLAGEWVLLGNNPERKALDLDSVAERRLNKHKDQLGKKLIRDWKVCPSITPRSWLLKYCQEDVNLTYQIFLQQHEELAEKALWHIALSRNLVIPVLAHIELNGLQLDKDRVYAEYTKQKDLAESIAEELDEITGGINLNSRPQVAKLLYETLGFAEAKDLRGNVIKTDAGKPSTAEETILRLEAETDVQKKFLDNYKKYVKATTLLSKTLTFLKKVCDHNDCVFYGNINQGRTQTHRLASLGMDVIFPGDKTPSKIQLQNIPRNLKPVFTAHDPDYLVREDDGAQLEFRCGADLGRDSVALKSIEDGEDVHALTRDVMRAHKHPDFEGLDDKEARQEAKPKTFQPMYGGKGGHKAEHAYADAWSKKYREMTQTQEDWCLRVAADKMLTTPYGMKFYWPRATMYGNGRVNVRTEVFNFPIQGFATAEIIPIALVFYWHRSKHLRVQIFNTVHDSIISRIHKDDNAEMDGIAKQALTYDVYNYLRDIYNYQFAVPLGLGTKVGTHWGDSKEEVVTDVWPDGRERVQIK